uniref:Zinc finger-like regulatory protein, putative n=1 Tax=Theileria annulata TaxID=5874 RepID=A0A3B0NCY6_THEAN
MANCSNTWAEKPIVPEKEVLDNPVLNVTEEIKGSILTNWVSPNDLTPYIESTSSSTTYISENGFPSQNISTEDNFNNVQDEDWANTLETCLNRPIDANFSQFYDYPERQSRGSFEEQLNNYFNENIDGIHSDFKGTLDDIDFKLMTSIEDIDSTHTNIDIDPNLINNIDIESKLLNAHEIESKLVRNLKRQDDLIVQKTVLNGCKMPNYGESLRVNERKAVFRGSNENNLPNGHNFSAPGGIHEQYQNFGGLDQQSINNTTTSQLPGQSITNENLRALANENIDNVTDTVSDLINDSMSDSITDTISDMGSVTNVNTQLKGNGSNCENNHSINGTYGGYRYPGSLNSNNVPSVGQNYPNSINCSMASKDQANQLAGSFLGDIFHQSELNGLSEVANDSYKDRTESLSYFNKDMINSINESYYKTLNNNVEIDYIFNNMDSLSRIDNLLTKDITDFGIASKELGLGNGLGLDLISDFNSDTISNDLLNNDALFSEIYRDNDIDQSEGWETLMKRLCISKPIKAYPNLQTDGINPLMNDNFNSIINGNVNCVGPTHLNGNIVNLNVGNCNGINTSIVNGNNVGIDSVNEPNNSGIPVKNKDNLPTILPADPNLGFKKTSLCKYWQRGICANDDCNFAHGKKELRSTIGVWRTTICHHWKTGVCRVGKDCRHAHGEEELQPKNIPANVLKNKLLNSARKYEYMRKKKSTF